MEKRLKYNITTHIVLLSPDSFSQNVVGKYIDRMFLGYEALLINQIITELK
jgi:hypothetical protein